MRLVYRADAGREIGTGHILRAARVIAQLPEAVRAGTVLAVAEDDAALCLVRSVPCQVCILPPRADTGVKPRFSAAPLLAAVDASSFDCVVVDMLDTPAGELAALSRAGCTVVTMDDRGQGRLEAHAVVNALVREREPDALSPHARLFQGPAYAALGPEYVENGPDRSTERPQRVVVSLGGADAAGLSIKVADALSTVEDLRSVTFICGLAFPHMDRLRAECIGAAWQARFLVNLPTLREALITADIGIVAGGFTMYEACRVGLPSVAVCQPIDHQIELAAELQGLGAMLSVGDGTGCSVSDIADAVRVLMRDGPVRRGMCRRGPTIVDGQGALRTAQAIEAVVRDRVERGEVAWKT